MMWTLESITYPGVDNLLSGTYIVRYHCQLRFWSICHKCWPVAFNEADAVPLIFSTVQPYMPKMSLTDSAIVSTVSYVPVVVLVSTCLCWYASLRLITPPSFLQVTLVAGPPVEVQVKDLVVSLYVNMCAVGLPATQNYAMGIFSGSKFFWCRVHSRYIQVGEYILSPQAQKV